MVHESAWREHSGFKHLVSPLAKPSGCSNGMHRLFMPMAGVSFPSGPICCSSLFVISLILSSHSPFPQCGMMTTLFGKRRNQKQHAHTTHILGIQGWDDLVPFGQGQAVLSEGRVRLVVQTL